MKTKFLVLFFFWKNKQMDNCFDDKTTDGTFTLFLLLRDCGFFCWKLSILFMGCTGRNYISFLANFLLPRPKQSCSTIKLCENLEQISCFPYFMLTLKIWYHSGIDFAYNNTFHILGQFVNKECTGYIMLQFGNLTSKI